MKTFAAIDIGGTAIKYGIVDETGAVLYNGETATEAHCGSANLYTKVQDILQHILLKNYKVSGIGISTAGVVDSKNGTIVYANDNIPGYTGTKWKEPLEKAFSVPVLVNNDVNCAALAEAWVGAVKGVDDFFCITVGTGVGGAAFINGRLYTGAHYSAAEIGNIITYGSNERFEKSASTLALVRMAEQKTGETELDGKVVFQKARDNDEVYTMLLAEWVEHLACGIANAIILFDPAVIVIGGGISREGDYLITKIKKGLAKFLPDQAFLDHVEIKPAYCGNTAGMIGAVYGFVLNR